MRLVGEVCMSLHMLACGSVVSCVVIVIVHIVRTRTAAYVRCMDIAHAIPVCVEFWEKKYTEAD